MKGWRCRRSLSEFLYKAFTRSQDLKNQSAFLSWASSCLGPQLLLLCASEGALSAWWMAPISRHSTRQETRDLDGPWWIDAAMRVPCDTGIQSRCLSMPHKASLNRTEMLSPLTTEVFRTAISDDSCSGQRGELNASWRSCLVARLNWIHAPPADTFAWWNPFSVARHSRAGFNSLCAWDRMQPPLSHGIASGLLTRCALTFDEGAGLGFVGE